MRGNNDNKPDIVVLVHGNVLARAPVRKRLESAGARAVRIAGGRKDPVVEKVLETSAEAGGDWIVALLGACEPELYRRLVPELIAHGIDDVIAGNDKNVLATLEHALEQAEKTLVLSTAIARTGHLLGRSRAMQTVRKKAALCIRSHALPVLILGETGTGKGQVAKAIHDADPRRHDKPFHTLDCGGITDTLFGSELFGHVRGAYTGALDNRRGAFECAGTGTLLLDEIGELSLPTQSYLLNALQERAYRPVGSDRKLEVRCRFVAATNRSLTKDIEELRFRQDLFHRLNGSRIRLPALRDRVSDVPVLFRHFIAAARKQEPKTDVEPAVFDFLQAQSFPGNVRELEAIAQQAAVRMGDERQVRLAHLPFDRMQVDEDSPDKTVEAMVQQGMQMSDIEAEIARQTTRAALRLWTEREPDKPRTEVVKQVARSLGVSPRTVYNKLNGAKRTS